jgi:hypothetical protein
VKLRVEVESAERLVLAPIPTPDPTRFVNLSTYLLAAGTLSACGVLLAPSSAAWWIVGGSLLLVLWMMSTDRVLRLEFLRDSIVATEHLLFLPVRRTQREYARQEVEVVVKVTTAYTPATLALRKIGSDSNAFLHLFQVSGVWTPAEFGRLLSRLQLTPEAEHIPGSGKAPPWEGTLPGKVRLLERTADVLHFGVRQWITPVAWGIAALVGALGLWVVRRDGPAAAAAGVEAMLGSLLFAAAVFVGGGSMRFRIDGARREVLDLQYRTPRRFPFEEIRAVLIRSFSGGRRHVTLLHRDESTLLECTLGAETSDSLAPFAGEIARRIGVPLLHRDAGAISA